jgi:hypothetical protein
MLGSMGGLAKLLPPITTLTGSWTQKIERYLLGKWGIDSTLSSATSDRFNANEVGGAGSGGAIYLKAANLVINNNVKISANGGKTPPGINFSGNAGATDGGGEGPAGGGGGRVYIEGTSSFINHASATNQNLTASGGQSLAATGTPRHGENGTVRVVRPQVSSLVFTGGTLTIDSIAEKSLTRTARFYSENFPTKPTQMVQATPTPTKSSPLPLIRSALVPGWL